MAKKKTNLKYWVELAMLVGILLMMEVTGLAMIPLPGQELSIMTVPVAVGAMILGPTAGGILGGVMGLISFYTAFKTGFPELALIGYGDVARILLSFLNTIPTRILMGILTGFIFKLLKKVDRTNTICYYVGGIAAPLLNTLFYMAVLVFVFRGAPLLENMATSDFPLETVNLVRDNVFLFVAAYVGIQAVIEAIAGLVIGGSVGKALSVALRIDGKKPKKTAQKNTKSPAADE